MVGMLIKINFTFKKFNFSEHGHVAYKTLYGAFSFIFQHLCIGLPYFSAFDFAAKAKPNKE